VTEVAYGRNVVPRRCAVGRAVTQSRANVTKYAKGDVSVPRIVQSMIGEDASPSTNAQVRINSDELDDLFLGTKMPAVACFALLLRQFAGLR